MAGRLLVGNRAYEKTVLSERLKALRGKKRGGSVDKAGDPVDHLALTETHQLRPCLGWTGAF